MLMAHRAPVELCPTIARAHNHTAASALYRNADGELHQHALLYKPDGFVSQMCYNDRMPSLRKGKQLLRDLPSVASLPADMHPIGRLDADTEGLLLLTTDGRLSHFVNKGRVFDKEYYAQVGGEIDAPALKRLALGGVDISLGNGLRATTMPCKAFKLGEPPQLPARRTVLESLIRKKQDGRILEVPTSWASLTLVEGKKRQVRKMTAAVGYPTLRLVRVRVGHIDISNMTPGELVPWDPGEELLRKANDWAMRDRSGEVTMEVTSN